MPLKLLKLHNTLIKLKYDLTNSSRDWNYFEKGCAETTQISGL